MFKKRNDFDQYLKNVRISFPVFHKAERRFFQDFSANVREYQAIHPMSTLSDLEGGPLFKNYYWCCYRFPFI